MTLWTSFINNTGCLLLLLFCLCVCVLCFWFSFFFFHSFQIRFNDIDLVLLNWILFTFFILPLEAITLVGVPGTVLIRVLMWHCLFLFGCLPKKRVWKPTFLKVLRHHTCPQQVLLLLNPLRTDDRSSDPLSPGVKTHPGPMVAR